MTRDSNGERTGADRSRKIHLRWPAVDSALAKNFWTTTGATDTNGRIPTPGAVTPTTPLRLEVAAQLAFPDGSITASALRRMVAAGKLDAELIAGKYYVTLVAIGEMRNRSRVSAGDRDLNSSNTRTACPNGSSATASKPLALDAMNATAKALKENLQNTSSKSTTRQKPSTAIIHIRPKLPTFCRSK